MTTDPQEALREAVREVLSECRISVHTAPWVEETDDGDVVRLELGRVNAEALADAVLPVVQAHEKALADEPESHAIRRAIRSAAEAKTDLAALRDAVSRLADSLMDESACGAPDAIRSTLEDAARRLRSLLGDKENN